VAEVGVVVEVHLGVERHEVIVLGDDERIDLDLRAILFHEEVVELGQQAREVLGRVAAQAERERHLARLIAGETIAGSMTTFVIRSGVLCATSSISMPPSVDASHRHAAHFAVEHEREIQLALDAEGLAR